ncbi:unnamed protein product [Timema podura]|uniref:Uncharacterized protein n=1 Tax=Timema podura TaxID=61482 RepID=A0ABN7NWD0_TIMPD|nr:unnamed protein product [Timema podura]
MVVRYSAKGRTNIELREQFILADGVSQSMTAFKPRTSLGGTQQRSQSVTAAGPITKVSGPRFSRSVVTCMTYDDIWVLVNVSCLVRGMLLLGEAKSILSQVVNFEA